jgi:hypothetical protein
MGPRLRVGLIVVRGQTGATRPLWVLVVWKRPHLRCERRPSPPIWPRRSNWQKICSDGILYVPTGHLGLPCTSRRAHTDDVQDARIRVSALSPDGFEKSYGKGRRSGANAAFREIPGCLEWGDIVQVGPFGSYLNESM